MPSQPETVNDKVLYSLSNIHADQNITIRLLDGSTLEIWGTAFYNGNPLTTIGSLPIATQPEAEAGVDNTKVMTPLRVSQAIDVQATGGGGGLTQEQVEDSVAALFSAGSHTNATVTYNDTTPSLSIAASGSGGGAVTSVNGETGIVVLNQDEVLDGTTYKQYSQTEKTKLAGVATGATANATDAQLRDRSTHTGTQSADTITDGSTNHVFTTADDTKLTGIATGATANSSDATLLARGNHTGSQAISTVTNLQTELDARVDTTGNETIAGTKTFSSDVLVPDEAYGAPWDGSLEVPTKNALYDKIQTLSAGGVTDVLHVGASAPSDATVELWFDTDETAETSLTNADISNVVTWTPTVGGLTKGNGVQTASYYKIGRICFLTYKFMLGSTSDVTAILTFNLPFTALDTTAESLGFAYDASYGSYPVVVTHTSTTQIELDVLAYGTTYSVLNATSSTVPMDWVNTDGIIFTHIYLTAS